jgi:hypothetical protein
MKGVVTLALQTFVVQVTGKRAVTTTVIQQNRGQQCPVPKCRHHLRIAPGSLTRKLRVGQKVAVVVNKGFEIVCKPVVKGGGKRESAGLTPVVRHREMAGLKLAFPLKVIVAAVRKVFLAQVFQGVPKANAALLGR